jgi:hypothetical protein
MKTYSDIDITDPRKLERNKAELTRLLEIVEFALGKYKHVGDNGQSELPLPVQAADVEHITTKDGRSIMEIVRNLPATFTTSDVMVALGNDGKDNRGRVKMALKRAVEAGWLHVAKAGVGRRPSLFEKVSNPP